jgi:hypothetical protein
LSGGVGDATTLLYGTAIDSVLQQIPNDLNRTDLEMRGVSQTILFLATARQCGRAIFLMRAIQKRIFCLHLYLTVLFTIT